LKFEPLFATLAAAAIASPGPGVLMTLTNALQHGLRAALGGILGIVAGGFLLAGLCASGVGLVLTASEQAFTAVKLAGAAYLAYLGVRLWRAPAAPVAAARAGSGEGVRLRFLEGLSLQLTNPKAIIFFLSVLPPFLRPADAGAPQFASLLLTWGALMLAIHGLYALFARQARHWLATPGAARAINRVGALTFMAFGATIAAALH
jgi:homoserine/homoserine lactone efflux protein